MRIGIDIGGTFTDIVAVDASGKVRTAKILSTPSDYGIAIEKALRSLLSNGGTEAATISDVVHGTTVAANAILSGQWARTGLITTEGFRDVLEIGRLRMPRLYDLTWEKPLPIVPRHLRVEVSERTRADGTVAEPLVTDSVSSAIDRLIDQGVESIAVCLLNAYANPNHEQIVGKALEHHAVSTSISHEVIPEIREFERTSTTVVNAAVSPLVESYLEGLQARLKGLGLEAPFWIMQSAGGFTDVETAATFPVRIIESGPAAGVVAAAELGRRIGVNDLIAFDMGGTTAKASLIEGGALPRAADFEVGGGVSHASRLMSGAGYHIRTPCINLSEVGAGGGSVIRVDAGGALQVGPESAGADPGPVCYGQGGELPTITDACLVLGFLGPQGLAGSTLKLDHDAARKAIKCNIAEPSNLSIEEASYGACRVAAARMVRAVRAVTAERGRDPRQYDLLAAGGSGPMHAVAIARELELKRVIVPHSPGVFSAFGLLAAPLQIDLVHTLLRQLDGFSTDELTTLVDKLSIEARAQLPGANVSATADLRYAGQSHELQIDISGGIGDLRAAFEEEHERTYGHLSEQDPVELVCLRLRATVTSQDVFEQKEEQSGDATASEREAYFGQDVGWAKTPILSRSALSEKQTSGPVIIEDEDATTVIPPWARYHLDEWGNIIIHL